MLFSIQKQDEYGIIKILGGLMKIENEITVLNINKEEFIKMILIAGLLQN